MNARQLCRWAAMQHPDSEVVVLEEAPGRVLLLPADDVENGLGLEVRVDGPTSSAFDNGEKEKRA